MLVASKEGESAALFRPRLRHHLSGIAPGSYFGELSEVIEDPLEVRKRRIAARRSYEYGYVIAVYHVL